MEMPNPNTGQLGRDLRGLLPAPSVIALTDRPGNRKPIKELIEGKYLKVEGGEIVAGDGGEGPSGTEDHRDLTHRGDANQHPASAISVDATVFNKNLNSSDTDVQTALVTVDQLNLNGDHKVKADTFDISPDFLQNKIKNGAHLVWTLDTAGGNQGMRGDVDVPTAATTIPLPDGVGDPGEVESYQYAAKGHIHPAVTPAAAATTLYTALKLDPLDHGQVSSVFIPYYSCGGSLWDGWTQISPGVMEKNTVGWLSSAQFDGMMVEPPFGGVSGLVGRIVLVYSVASTTDADKALSGPYVVEDAGAYWNWDVDHWNLVETNARMRRAPGYEDAADFIQGMVFQAQTGNSYGTGFFSLDTAQPITLGVTPLSWTFHAGPTYTWNPVKELLTGSQLVSEGVSNETLYLSKSVGGDGNAAFDGLPTLVGTPGLSSLPAGLWRFFLDGLHIDADIGGNTGISCEMYRSGATSGTLFTTPLTLWSNPTIPQLVTIDYTAPEFPWDPADLLVLIVHVQNTISTGTDLVTASFIYNSASRGTKVTVPFDIAGGTSGDHRYLSHRNDPSQHLATAVDTDITNFNKNLSTADTTVQEALDTLDNLTVDHAKYLDTVTGNVAIGTAYQPVQPGEALVTTGTGTAADWTFVVTASSIMAASTTVASGVVPISDGSGTLNSWVTHASGDLSSNTAITASGSVYKIVQYDTKGLVLVGADANPANIGAVAGSGTISGTTNYLPKKTATGWGDSRISDNVSSGTVTIEGGTAPAGYPPLLKLIGTSYLGIDLTGATGGYALAIANNQFITMANTLGAPISLLGVSSDNITYLGANSGNSIRIATPLGYRNSDGITVQGTTNFVGIGKSPSELLDVAGTVGVLSLKLNGSGSGVVTYGVADTTASYTMLAPSTAPATGQVIAYPSGGGQGTWVTPTVLPTNAIGWLYNNGSGVLSWSASTIASSIATSTTNVSIGTTAPTGSGQAIVTTSTTAATWQTVATMNTTVPQSLTYGGSGSAGTGTTAAHVDHVHGLANITGSQVITALGYTPGTGTVTGFGTINTVSKWTSTTALGNSQISDDGSTVTVGTIANSRLRVTGGTSGVTLGQLSDATSFGAVGVTSGALSTTQYILAGDNTTNTRLNAAAGTVSICIANTPCASFTSTGIAATNITSTPGASKIPISDGNGTLNSWVAREQYIYIGNVGQLPGYISTGGSYVIGGMFMYPNLFSGLTHAELHIIGYANGSGTNGGGNFILYDLTHGSVQVGTTVTIPYNSTAQSCFSASLTLGGSNGNLRTDNFCLYQLNAASSGNSGAIYVLGCYIRVY